MVAVSQPSLTVTLPAYYVLQTAQISHFKERIGHVTGTGDLL